MIDMVELVEARRRMNLRRVLWFRCMYKVCETPAETPKFSLYSNACQVLAEAYSVSCEEVRTLEKI